MADGAGVSKLYSFPAGTAGQWGAKTHTHTYLFYILYIPPNTYTHTL